MSFWVVPAVAPNRKTFPLCCPEKLVLVGGVPVRPNVCPQPTTGTTVRLVCALSSPLPKAGLTVEWCGPCLGYLHTARLVVLGIWHISWGGSARCMGVGGAGSACFSSRDLLREGPCGTGRESDPSPEAGGMDPQKHSVGCLHSASKFPGSNWFPLGFWLGDG